MESSVRYVQLPNAGQKPALCFRGSKTAYAVINFGTIHTIDLSLKDYDKATRVKSTRAGGEDYSPLAFREAFLRMIQKQSLRVTNRAKLLLEEGAHLKADAELPHEEVLPLPGETNDEEETVEVGLDKNDNVTIDGKSPPDLPKAPRKLPKRINREGKAEEPLIVGTRSPHETTVKRTNGRVGAPRAGDLPRKPVPLAPLPNRAAETVRKDVQAKAKRVSTEGKTLVAALASEAGLSQQPCRVKLRAAGLRAPYDEKNEAACRKALGLPLKGVKK